MVIAEKPSKKEPKVAARRETAERWDGAGSSENPISTIKNFVCKYLSARPICAQFCDHTRAITTTSGPIDHWTKMRRFLARFS